MELADSAPSEARFFWYQGEAWYHIEVGAEVMYVSPTRIYRPEDGVMTQRDLIPRIGGMVYAPYGGRVTGGVDPSGQVQVDDVPADDLGEGMFRLYDSNGTLIGDYHKDSGWVTIKPRGDSNPAQWRKVQIGEIYALEGIPTSWGFTDWYGWSEKHGDVTSWNTRTSQTADAAHWGAKGVVTAPGRVLHAIHPKAPSVAAASLYSAAAFGTSEVPPVGLFFAGRASFFWAEAWTGQPMDPVAGLINLHIEDEDNRIAAQSAFGALELGGAMAGIKIFPPRATPVQHKINIGGKKPNEAPGIDSRATNLNNLSCGQEACSIPDILIGDAFNLAKIFKPRSCSLIYSQELTASLWLKGGTFARQAFKTLAPGGKVMMNMFNASAQEIRLFMKQLKEAGFVEVKFGTPHGNGFLAFDPKVSPSGGFVHAVKPR